MADGHLRGANDFALADAADAADAADQADEHDEADVVMVESWNAK